MSTVSLKSKLLSTGQPIWWCLWCGKTIKRGISGRPRSFCNTDCVEHMLEDAKRRHASGERIPDQINILYGQLRHYRAAEAAE